MYSWHDVQTQSVSVEIFSVLVGFFFALFHLFWGNVRLSKGKHYIIQNSRENNIIQNSRENKLKIRNDINIKNWVLQYRFKLRAYFRKPR